MFGQPLLQPDCGKGKGGIHRCLQEEDQPFWGTLITSLNPGAWWSGRHPQTSRVFSLLPGWITLVYSNTP